MNVAIRKVKLDDLSSISQVNLAAYGHPIDPIILRQYFELFAETYLVAVYEGEIVGFCIGAIKFRTDEGWILDLAVMPSIQKKGVGRKLTNEMLDILQGMEIRSLLLTVNPLNKIAIDLYKKFGFEPLKIHKDYFGKGSDRILMRVYLLHEKAGE